MKIQIENKQNIIKIDRSKIRNTVLKLLNIMACSNYELCISFVDDLLIKQLNNKYLQRDKTTNVLSFSLQEGEFSNINPHILGDIVISVETAQKDALRGGLSLSHEIDFLLIHGLLHLLGYNHENTTRYRARKMRLKENELFIFLNGDIFNKI